jgi:hypothetical protein
MVKILLCLSSGQKADLAELKLQTGLPVNELLRRLIDYGLQQKVLNELVPCQSGTIKVGGNGR